MNKKNFIMILIGILLVIVIGIIVYFSFKQPVTYNILKSSDEKFSIDIPSNIEYKINPNEDNEFTINIYSVKDEMYIYASSLQKTRDLDLLDIVTDDKTSYVSSKENMHDESNINLINIKDYKAYDYNFRYFDSSYGKDFYSNVVWIETPNNLYVLNFEVISDNSDKYIDIFTTIKNSFVEL